MLFLILIVTIVFVVRYNTDEQNVKLVNFLDNVFALLLAVASVWFLYSINFIDYVI